MSVLTLTNPLFVKTGLLKLNDVFKLQVCKLMKNSMTGFDVEHKNFTQAILFIQIKQGFLEN